MIEVRKLVKRFGLKTVLRGLDFQVQPGEFVALLGPNGAARRPSCASWHLSPARAWGVRIAGHPLPAQASIVRRRLGWFRTCRYCTATDR